MTGPMPLGPSAPVCSMAAATMRADLVVRQWLGQVLGEDGRLGPFLLGELGTVARVERLGTPRGASSIPR